MIRRLPWPLDALWAVLADALGRFQRHRCTTAAAAIAFHVLFSVFPLLLLITAIVGTSLRDPDVRSRIVDGLMSTLPLEPSARDQIDRVLTVANANLAAIGILGAVALIWSASGMLGSVRGAMELAWTGHRGTRPFVRGKLVDAVLLTILVTLILSSFVLGVLVGFVPRLPAGFPEGHGIARDIVETVRSWIGLVASLLTTFLVTLLAYKLLPRPRPALRYAVTAAALASVGFEVARRAFEVYLTRVARYDLVYGSIGSIIALLFFVYISAIILLFGAELGASLRRVHLAGRLGRPRGGSADGP